MISDGGTSTLWEFLPGLSLLSIAVVIFELHQRYKSDQISLDEFKSYAAKATGLKLAKITMIVALLSLPGINVVVGTVLVAKLILTALDWKSDKPPMYNGPQLSKERLLKPYAPDEQLKF